MKIRPINNSKCSNERKSHLSQTLNQKLENLIKLSEEGTSKDKIDQKLGLLHKTVSQIINNKGKILVGNEKCYTSKHLNVKKEK